MQATQDRLLRILGTFRTIAFCEECLALKLGAFPGEVQEALRVIGAASGLRATPGQCSECLQRTRVVRAPAA